MLENDPSTPKYPPTANKGTSTVATMTTVAPAETSHLVVDSALASDNKNTVAKTIMPTNTGIENAGNEAVRPFMSQLYATAIPVSITNTTSSGCAQRTPRPTAKSKVALGDERDRHTRNPVPARSVAARPMKARYKAIRGVSVMRTMCSTDNMKWGANADGYAAQ
jgi:hypothetical protein